MTTTPLTSAELVTQLQNLEQALNALDLRNEDIVREIAAYRDERTALLDAREARRRYIDGFAAEAAGIDRELADMKTLTVTYSPGGDGARAHAEAIEAREQRKQEVARMLAQALEHDRCLRALEEE